MLLLVSARSIDINAVAPCFPLCSGHSPAVVHFFFQYWTGLPFGLGVLFFPLLLIGLWQAMRRWPWAITAVVIVPFVIFAVYWGASSTGMLREGLQAWVLTLLIVVAVEQCLGRFSWLRHASLRGLLALRSVEILLVAMLPTIVTRHRVYQQQFRLTDLVAVGAIFLSCGFLGWLVLRGSRHIGEQH
jgi:hypothetical protein